MVMRTSLTAAFFLAASLFASTDVKENGLKEIESKLNSILNKAGIQLSGTFRSQYLSSTIDDKSGDSVVNYSSKTNESNEYTSVDFDITARPNDALCGRLIFRMHQNWQNFFSDIANPIFSRWISIDGNVKEMFRFNVGDFRQHYSPLTLWSPDIEILYEPEIFASKRREAMKEVFLGNNDRILQGVNFNLDAEVVPIFNEMHFNVNAARLRLNNTNWTNGSAVADRFEGSDMDRYEIGTNLDVLALRGLGVGGTFLSIFDYIPTYNGSIEKARVLSDTRRGFVYGGRIAPDSRIFLDADAFLIGLYAEVMNSSNLDTAWYTVDAASGDSTLHETIKSGIALDAALKGKIKLGKEGTVSFSVGFMNNDNDYINEMAQSPTFMGQRIMNIENDYESKGQLYTTYDALYNYVFKFAPSSNNKWTKEPHRKISYLNAILTRDEIESKVDFTAGPSLLKLDPALQLVFPYGPATPNRTGPKFDVNLKLFNNGVDIGAYGAILSEIDPDTLYSSEKTSFMRVGGGFCIDVATWAKALNSFKISVGYSLESAKNGKVMTGTETNAFESNNGFFNFGIYYNFWKRFSVLAGHQQIINETKISDFTETYIQGHFAAGLEYRVNNASSVTCRLGRLGARYKDSSQTEEANKLRKFNIWQTEFFLTVDF